MAFKRSRMSGGKSRRTFTKFALRHHKKNYASNPMRGGIRL